MKKKVSFSKKNEMANNLRFLTFLIIMLGNFLLLIGCQSINVIKDGFIPDAKPQFEERVIMPFQNIKGRIANYYAKSSLKDYIGELDKKNLDMIIQKVANTGQTQIFTNQESGVQAKVEVINSKILPTQEIGKTNSTRECKTIKQTIILKDKREIIENIQLCKDSNRWR
tara:strand:- start:10218 stop:10724 length:507 start_codon:yes stop_codon:yes gene_type:complete